MLKVLCAKAIHMLNAFKTFKTLKVESSRRNYSKTNDLKEILLKPMIIEEILLKPLMIEEILLKQMMLKEILPKPKMLSFV